METSNIYCQKDLEIDPSTYRLHKSEFTTPSVEKGMSRYWFYSGSLRKSVLHLLCVPDHLSFCVFIPFPLRKPKPKQNPFEPSRL